MCKDIETVADKMNQLLTIQVRETDPESPMPDLITQAPCMSFSSCVAGGAGGEADV